MKRETTLLILSVAALTCIGLLMVYSTGSVDSDVDWRKQSVVAAAGFLLMLVVARFDYHCLADGVIYRGLTLGAVVLLVLVLIPGIGIGVAGGQRWLPLPGTRFQPSEVARLVMVILLAVKLTQNRERLGKFFAGFVPPFLLALLFCGLVVMENDLGMPAMMMAVAYILIYAAGARWWHIGLSLAPVGVAGVLLILVAPHRLDRVRILLDPWLDREGKGFQLIESLLAFANGGLTGQGVGAGDQKLGHLPAAGTDFVFATLGEELGLIGTLTVVLLYGVMLYAAIRIAMRAPDMLGSLLATGIGALVATQATFMMGVNVGLLPTKGLTLPFVSYGGTSLLVYLLMMGILANVGAQSTEVEAPRRLVPAA